jgi:hypothetical protein
VADRGVFYGCIAEGCVAKKILADKSPIGVCWQRGVTKEFDTERGPKRLQTR